MSGPRRGVFFVHVMKTGGVSLSSVMRAWFPPASTYPDDGAHRGPFPKTFVAHALALRATEGRPRDFYSVHMPAWVADAVAPGHLKVTVLRDPVARTVSHLRQIAERRPELGSLEEIYDRPRWHERLLDYQVRLFATTQADEEREQDRLRALVDGGPLPEASMVPVLMSGISVCAPLGADALDRAVATLDAFDVVGVTEDLDGFLARVCERVGVPRGPVAHRNRGSETLVPPAAFLERLRREQERDLALYEHARALVLSRGGVAGG